MEKEFNLRDEECYDAVGKFFYFKPKSIKEFIKRLKDWIDGDFVKHNKPYPPKIVLRLKMKIDKLAGEKLNG